MDKKFYKTAAYEKISEEIAFQQSALNDLRDMRKTAKVREQIERAEAQLKFMEETRKTLPQPKISANYLVQCIEDYCDACLKEEVKEREHFTKMMESDAMYAFTRQECVIKAIAIANKARSVKEIITAKDRCLVPIMEFLDRMEKSMTCEVLRNIEHTSGNQARNLVDQLTYAAYASSSMCGFFNADYAKYYLNDGLVEFDELVPEA